MPDATVNIGGDASGALAAVAAAQGAIDALHGKTVNVDINVRQNGSGVGGLAGDLGRVRDAADRASRAGRGMGDSFDRAGRSAHGMGDHVGRAADHAGRLNDHLDAVNRIMGGGAPSSISRSASGMRQLANEADRARGSIGEIGSGSVGMRAIESGAASAGRGFRGMAADAHATTVEVMGIYRNARQAITSAGEMGSAFSTASGHTSQMGTDLARTGASAGQAGKELAKVGDAVNNIGRSGNGLSGIDLAAKGLRDTLGSATSGFEGVGSTLGGVAGMAGSAARPLMMVGLVAGVSAIGMGALGAAVAGVGLAGVAEDFAHNSQLMNKGQEAIRGFNKEFRQMRSETSAAGLPGMDALGTSIKGVGHELARIGADNMAPTLKHANDLAGTLTQTMKQLAPAIGPSEQALTSLAGAALGAFGNSAPEIARFANIVTQNAGGLQSATESIVRGASALGGGLVQGVSAAAPFLHGAANAAAWGTDAVSGAFGIPSNFSSTPGPDGSLPGSVDTGVPDGMGGTVKTPGASPLSKFFSGAAKGAPIGAAVGLFGGPAAEITAPIGGLIGGIGGGLAGLFGVPGFTPADPNASTGPMNLGPPQSQKSMGIGSRAGAGNFGPGSGGPMVPPGQSAADALTSARADAGLPPVGHPMYSGVGPRGPGQSVGPMPVSAAVGLGGGGVAPLNDMMRAAAPQIAGGGASTGAAMVQHIQKAVSVAAPAAVAGGAAIGGGVSGGIAAGTTSTMTVTDTVMVKHVKHLIEIAAGALGIHSPSKEFDYLGRMTMAGFGQGAQRASAGTFGAMSNHMGGVLSAAQDGVQKFGYDYQDGSAPVVSVRKQDPNTAREYSPDAMARFQAHNDRAAALAAAREGRQRQAIGGMTHDERRDQLLQNRAGLHERALANLHISGHAKPSGDVNPFAADQARSRGLNAVINPFSQLPGMFNKAGQNSAQGLSQGLSAHVGKIQASGAALAGAGHAGYKKKDKQSSPSAEWAAIGGNSVAGAVGGVNAGIPSLAAAGSGMAGAMQNAAVGPMSDSGLQIGYTWSRSVLTGAQSQLKTADFQAGTPNVDNEQIATALAGTNSLGGYGGASVYKNKSLNFDGSGAVAALTAALQGVTTQPQVIQISLDSQPFRDLVTEGGNQLFELLLNALTGANG